MRLGNGSGNRGRLLAVRGLFRVFLAGVVRDAPKLYTNSSVDGAAIFNTPSAKRASILLPSIVSGNRKDGPMR